MLPKIRYEYWKAKEKNNKSVIAIVATLKGKRKYFSTGVEIESKFWTNKSLDKKMPNYNEIERIVRLKMQEIEKKFLFDASLGKEIVFTNEKKIEDNPKFYDIGIEKFNSLKNKSKKSYLDRRIAHLNEFIAVVGDIRVNDITVENLVKYEQALLNRGIAPNTINTRSKCLKSITNYYSIVYDKQITAFKKHKFISYKNPKRVHLTFEQLKILKEIDLSKNPTIDNIRNLFLVGCSTGLRYSDLAKIKKEDIILDGGNYKIVIKQEKTEDIVAIPINMETYNLILNIKYVPSNAYYNRLLKKLAGICNIEYLSTHVARHTLGTQLLEVAPLEVVSKILGHKNIQTTRIYAQVTDNRVKNAMEQFYKKFSDTKTLPLK